MARWTCLFGNLLHGLGHLFFKGLSYDRWTFWGVLRDNFVDGGVVILGGGNHLLPGNRGFFAVGYYRVVELSVWD